MPFPHLGIRGRGRAGADRRSSAAPSANWPPASPLGCAGPEGQAGRRWPTTDSVLPASARLPAGRSARLRPSIAPHGTRGRAWIATAPPQRTGADQRPILDRLPIGVLVYRLDKLIYANKAFLDWTGYQELYALEQAGGLDALFVEPNHQRRAQAPNNGSQALTIATNQGDQMPVKARLFTSPWEGESALVLMLTGLGETGGDDRQKTFEIALRHAKAELRESRELLDAAADGVVVLDAEAQVQSINRGGEKLFGYAGSEINGLPFASLFAQESQREVHDLCSANRINRPGKRAEHATAATSSAAAATAKPRSAVHDASSRDGRRRRALRHLPRHDALEEDRGRAAQRQTSGRARIIGAEVRTSSPRSATRSCTPLPTPSSDFPEVMMQERFGPVGNERYRQYLKDIHTFRRATWCALLNDLLDLSKIDAGKIELNFADVDLNELTQQSVALMQPAGQPRAHHHPHLARLHAAGGDR